MKPLRKKIVWLGPPSLDEGVPWAATSPKEKGPVSWHDVSAEPVRQCWKIVGQYSTAAFKHVAMAR